MNMSNQQPSRPPSGSPRQSGGPQSSPGGGGGAIFDPLKLLQKYKFVMVGAVILGVFVGVVSHFVALRFFPGFKSTVLLECNPVETEIQALSVGTIDEDEMARFMGTQVNLIKGETVNGAVLADARLEQEAGEWYNQFVHNSNLNVIDARKSLEKKIKAQAIPNTYLIQISVKVGNRNDAAGLVRLVKENYLSILTRSTSSGVTERKQAINEAINEADETVAELTNRKNRLLKDGNLNSIDVENSAEAVMLRSVNENILVLQQAIEGYQVQLQNDEKQLQRSEGIVYDSLLRDRVEQSPIILNLQQQITQLKTTLLTLQSDGIMPEHRTYKQVLSQLEAFERKLEDKREELLAEAFETRIDATRMALQQYQAQIADLVSEQEDLAFLLNELSQTSEEIAEINRQIESALEMKGEQQTNLADLNQAAGLDSASRITVIKPESIPDRPAFPKMFIMVPLGVFLITGLTAGVLVVFELLDQRVKSGADIAMIPRTRVLGIIPDAEEDPASHASIETLFMDSPNSVLAEHYRQLRTRITKNMLDHGHKTLLVAGAMPGSGATSVATNLAQACVAAGKKTLLIDTNFRRARIHTAFGLLETPGLGEILAGEKTLSECTQSTSENGPDIISAGARNLRVVERLGTPAIGELLAQASNEYDIVLLDVAPAIVAGDAVTLSNLVDATILVVRAMSEKRGQVARLKNELSDSRSEFLGVLVNGVRSSAGGYMRKNIRTSHQYHTTGSEQPA
jgi:polysaccharide biosynthesis transport protein